MTNPSRNCPVCSMSDKRLLFQQQFGTLSRGSLLTGFELVVCARCGAGYADDIPAQEAFNRYYAEMSKYEYLDRAGVQTQTDLHRFKEVADLVEPQINVRHRLLDIGCSTGGLLAEFKRRGFSNLLGIDPSPACAKLTEQLYGIRAIPLTISTLGQLGEKVDVAFLTGVLEHLRDVDTSIDIVKSCLNPNGFIYFEVPDATRYDRHFSAPFQLLSMEHVNYFSPVSLINLLARHGFSLVFCQRLIRHLSPKAIEPGIGALFRLKSEENGVSNLVHDAETEAALERYIEQSRALEKRLHERISAIAESNKKLAVWGVGTHTLRLLETSRLRYANIVIFIDSNANYQGKSLEGIPVIAPSAFTDKSADILISSQAAEDEIFHLIKEKLHWPNVVHRLYEE